MKTIGLRTAFIVCYYSAILGQGTTLTQLCKMEVPDPLATYRMGPLVSASQFIDYLTTPLKRSNPKSCRETNKASQYPVRYEGTILVDCGRCTVFDVDIKASMGDICWGLTRELLYSKQECFWKKSCRLQYSPSFIIWSPHNEPTCVAQFPTGLELLYSCLNTDAVPVHNVIKDTQEVKSESGLINTHAHCDTAGKTYPKSGYSGSQALTVLPEEGAKPTSFVLVHVIQLHNYRGDELSISDDLGVCPTTWKEGETYRLHGDRFTVAFRVGEDQRNPLFNDAGCARLCFQWFHDDSASVDREFEETIKICKESTNKRKTHLSAFSIMQELSSHHEDGVLRSHSKFPWNYPLPLQLSGSSRMGGPFRNRALSVPRTHQLLRPLGMNDSWLRISLVKFALAPGDVLVISSDKGIRSHIVQSEKDLFSVEGHVVNVTLETGYRTRQTDSGFVLCYKWYPKYVKPENVTAHPCEKYLFQSFGCAKNQCPSQCRPPKSKTKKKKKNDQRKKNRGRKNRSKNKKGKRKARP